MERLRSPDCKEWLNLGVRGQIKVAWLTGTETKLDKVVTEIQSSMLQLSEIIRNECVQTNVKKITDISEQVPIKDLHISGEMSTRTYNSLARVNIKSLGQISKIDFETLHRIRNLVETSCEEMQCLWEKYGFERLKRKEKQK